MLPLETYPTHSPDPTAATCQGVHYFVQRDEEPSGQFEVYWMDADIDENGNDIDTGWYWIALAGDDPRGPFQSSRNAFVDAQEACQ